MGLLASTEDSDESLMRLIRQDSHQAFSILVRRHTDRFFAGAYRMCGNTQEAEDMVQDAFLKIWNNPDIWKEDKGAKFTTWFYRILVNANIDRLRKTQKVVSGETILPFIADAGPTPETQTAEGQEQQKMERALATLPERQKTALTLCFYEGLSNAEAAEAMGVKIKALESLLMRAKTGLREYLKQNNNPAQGGLYAAR